MRNNESGGSSEREMYNMLGIMRCGVGMVRGCWNRARESAGTGLKGPSSLFSRNRTVVVHVHLFNMMF